MSGEMLNYFLGLFSSLVSTCCMSSLMFFSKSSTLLPISSSRPMIWSDICSNFCCCKCECGAREVKGETERKEGGKEGAREEESETEREEGEKEGARKEEGETKR